MMLKCSSTDEDVDFTWQVKPPSVTLRHMTINSSSVGFALFTQDHIKLSCTSSRNTDNVSNVSTVKCDGKDTQKKKSLS